MLLIGGHPWHFLSFQHLDYHDHFHLSLYWCSLSPLPCPYPSEGLPIKAKSAFHFYCLGELVIPSFIGGGTPSSVSGLLWLCPQESLLVVGAQGMLRIESGQLPPARPAPYLLFYHSGFIVLYIPIWERTEDFLLFHGIQTHWPMDPTSALHRQQTGTSPGTASAQVTVQCQHHHCFPGGLCTTISHPQYWRLLSRATSCEPALTLSPNLLTQHSLRAA